MAATLELNSPSDVHPVPRPWSLGDAARELGLSERYVAALIAENKIRSIKFGRRRLVPDAELRRLAENGIG